MPSDMELSSLHMEGVSAVHGVNRTQHMLQPKTKCHARCWLWLCRSLSLQTVSQKTMLMFRLQHVPQPARHKFLPMELGMYKEAFPKQHSQIQYLYFV